MQKLMRELKGQLVYRAFNVILMIMTEPLISWHLWYECRVCFDL